MVGDLLTLECMVSTVRGVEFDSVMISWMGPGGRIDADGSRVIVNLITSSNNVYTSIVQFTYLMEGDNGTYTCNVMVLEVPGTVSIDLGTLASE